jgi:hypothetical protein
MSWQSKFYLTKELWFVNGRKEYFMKTADLHISPMEILECHFKQMYRMTIEEY